MAAASGPLTVRTFTSPGFGENGYLATCKATEIAVIIDPGSDTDAILQAVENVEVDAVLLTHAHLDHIQGVAAVVEATGAPVYLHETDHPLYAAAGEQAAMFGMPAPDLPPIDHALEDGQEFSFGECSFQILHAPGHAPGHVICHAAEAGLAFVGDVIFQASIGRTDLPGGNYQTLMRSIRERVLALPDDTVLYSGHGPATTVGHERVSNPFLTPQYGGGMA